MKTLLVSLKEYPPGSGSVVIQDIAATPKKNAMILAIRRQRVKTGSGFQYFFTIDD